MSVSVPLSASLQHHVGLCSALVHTVGNMICIFYECFLFSFLDAGSLISGLKSMHGNYKIQDSLKIQCQIVCLCMRLSKGFLTKKVEELLVCLGAMLGEGTTLIFTLY